MHNKTFLEPDAENLSAGNMSDANHHGIHLAAFNLVYVEGKHKHQFQRYMYISFLPEYTLYTVNMAKRQTVDHFSLCPCISIRGFVCPSVGHPFPKCLRNLRDSIPDASIV